MRLVAAVAVIATATAEFESARADGTLVIHILAIAAGILLIAGLWTPIAAALVAIFAVWRAVTVPSELHAGILLAAIAAALTLLGPGMYSIDARVFGWKRINLHRDEA